MSETRHHIRSVSDLYAADEIEVLLLEEIRDLEPPPSAYSRPEDIQDFEIAGSRTGGRISSQSSELDSPGVHSTVHSWDSHANYHGRYGHGDHHGHGSSSNALPWPRASHLVFYCDVQGHLRTATGVVRLLLLVTSAACLATLCSSGTAKVSLFMLPLVGRLRFMIFVTVFCILVTALLLFLDISHVVYLFPFNWARLNAWVFTGIGLSYALSSALLVCSIWEYHGGGWVPRRTRSQLSAVAALGLSSALLAFLLSWIHGCGGSACKGQDNHNHVPSQLYKPVDNSSSSGVTLKERSPKRSTSWSVKNQQSKRRGGAVGGGGGGGGGDSDTNTNTNTNTNDAHRGNDNGNNCDKYKVAANRKDHWASARQHFLPAQDDEDLQRGEDSETDRRRRRSRKYGETPLTLSADKGLTGNKGESNRDGEAGKGRCVPRKLPLQSFDHPNPRASGAGHKGYESKQSRSKASEMAGSSDAQCYWDVKQSAAIQVTGNGFHWEMEGGSSNGKEIDSVTAIRTTAWAGRQFHPAPDDAQPCSSKTIDPYGFT